MDTKTLTTRLAAEFHQRRTDLRYRRDRGLKLSRMLSAEFAKRRHVYGKDFVESEHPRDEDGKFTSGIGKVGRSLLEKGRRGKPFFRLVFHGSKEHGLDNISSTSKGRAFDIALSRLGAFFAMDRQEASRYAGPGGAVYGTHLLLNNPFRMPLELFEYLEDLTTDGDGHDVPPEQEDARMEELTREASSIRQYLQEKGYPNAS